MNTITKTVLLSLAIMALLLSGCESTQGAGGRIQRDLKKTSQKVEKGISDASSGLRKSIRERDERMARERENENENK